MENLPTWMSDRKGKVCGKKISPNTRRAMSKPVGQGSKCSKCKKKRSRQMAFHGIFLIAMAEIWGKVDDSGVLIGYKALSGDLRWCHIWKRGIS